MITPCVKPLSFFPEEAADDLFMAQQRKAKLEGYMQTLAAMDELIDFAAMAAAVDKACLRAVIPTRKNVLRWKAKRPGRPRATRFCGRPTGSARRSGRSGAATSTVADGDVDALLKASGRAGDGAQLRAAVLNRLTYLGGGYVGCGVTPSRAGFVQAQAGFRSEGAGFSKCPMCPVDAYSALIKSRLMAKIGRIYCWNVAFILRSHMIDQILHTGGKGLGQPACDRRRRLGHSRATGQQCLETLRHIRPYAGQHAEPGDDNPTHQQPRACAPCH
jgi:hypothetical protein